MLKPKISPKVGVNCQLNLVEDHEHQLNTLDDDLQRCNMLRNSFQALVLTQKTHIQRYTDRIDTEPISDRLAVSMVSATVKFES